MAAALAGWGTDVANPNVFQQLVQPQRSVMDYSSELDRQDLARSELQQRQQQNALHNLAVQQQMQKQNALQRIAAGWGADTTDEQRVQSLRSNPLTFDAADALDKSILERTKTRAAAAKDQSDAGSKDVETENKVIAVYRDMIGMAQSPAAAAELVKVMHSDPRLAKTAFARVPVEQGLAQISADPEGFAQWKQQFGLGATRFIEQNKPQFIQQNTGGASIITAVPGLGGAATQVSSVQNTQSPDNAATQATARRGQNMVDARAREANAITQQQKAAPKPLPGTAVKMQNEDLEAIGTFRGLDADLQALEGQLSNGKLKLGLATNAVGAARNAVGLSDENSRNLASFKSKLENLRNSVLLLNKGVQTEGDAQRAMNEIMANINDQEVVKQRLAELRAINRRAADLRKNNVDLLRSNYGAEPLDYSKYDQQPAALDLPKPGAPAKTKSGATASNW